jgi:hypothetical protein
MIAPCYTGGVRARAAFGVLFVASVVVAACADFGSVSGGQDSGTIAAVDATPVTDAASVLDVDTKPVDAQPSETSPEDTGPPDTGMSDAAPPDTGPADSGPPQCQLGNLLGNGNFEDGTAWSAVGLQLTPSALAHAGKKSGKLCGDGAGYISQGVSVPAGEYFFVGWLRSDPSAPAPERATLHILDANAHNTAAISDSWQCIEGKGTVPATNAAGLDLYNPTPGRVCALVDDLAIYAVPAGGIPAECKCP